MTQFDINRQQKIYGIISVLKLISLLFCGMVVFAQSSEEKHIAIWLDSTKGSIFFIGFLCIAILILIYQGWIYSNKNNQTNQEFKLSALIENIIFILIYTALIWISGFHESQYKFLFLTIKLILFNTGFT